MTDKNRLYRCRSKYFNLEWRFNELKRILYGVLEAHRFSNFIDERLIKL
jgi:hypothetical protein